MSAPNVPSVPDADRRERLLGVVAELIGRAGVAPFLAPPVKPGGAAFPEPWKPTRGGVEALLRRLAWHAGGLGGRSVTIRDERLGAPPTEHKPQTRVTLDEVRAKEMAFSVVYIGEDDIVGTLAHEIGVAFAALHRPDEADPYRTAAEREAITIEQEKDLERGSIATAYLGLGVLAANAAFQQYSTRVGVDAYQPHVYEVHRAGYVKMSDLAFLLAVQAVVRGERAAPPGLGPPQRDEVTAWIDALVRDAVAVDGIDALDAASAQLRTRLGIAAGERAEPRAKPVRFTDVDLRDDEVSSPVAKRTAFRWHTHRGGTGMLLGLALGLCAGYAVAAVAMSQTAFFLMAIAGVGIGRVIGASTSAVRCSGCATIVGKDATACRKCGAALRGDIKRLAERLEAEERLELASGDGTRATSRDSEQA